MHRFLIPGPSGHEVVEFDKADPEQLRAAQALFDKLVKEERKVAYERKGKGQASLLREHDPGADETVFFNPMQGG